MSCYGNQASLYVVNLPPGTVDSNGNNTLDCCECPCGATCAPVVLANLWSNPNGGSVSFASAFSTCDPQLGSNCPNMAWVMNGWYGGNGYGNYVNGTFDANGCLVIRGINNNNTSFNAGSSTLTSYYLYSDAVSIVAYDASNTACSPSTPPAPPSICGSYREPGNSYDYPAFLCGTPNPGCANPVEVDQYGTCCACTTTTTTTTTTTPCPYETCERIAVSVSIVIGATWSISSGGSSDDGIVDNFPCQFSGPYSIPGVGVQYLESCAFSASNAGGQIVSVTISQGTASGPPGTASITKFNSCGNWDGNPVILNGAGTISLTANSCASESPLCQAPYYPCAG